MMFGCFGGGGGDDPSTNPKGSNFGSAVPLSCQTENPLSPWVGKTSRTFPGEQWFVPMGTRGGSNKSMQEGELSQGRTSSQQRAAASADG